LEELEHSVLAAEANPPEHTISGFSRFKSIFGRKQEPLEVSQEVGPQVQVTADITPQGSEHTKQPGKAAKPLMNLSEFNKDAYWAAVYDDHSWPAKTQATTAYRCQFEREGLSRILSGVREKVFGSAAKKAAEGMANRFFLRRIGQKAMRLLQPLT
jgi:hypothetical protein